MAMATTSRLICATLLTCLVLASAAPRVRRQLSFTIINNQSLPCSSVSSEYGPSTQIVDLTDDEKMELLRMHGGQYLPRYMARTREESVANFHNQLTLPKVFQERIKSFRSSKDGAPLKKKEIVDYMMNHIYTGFSKESRLDAQKAGSEATDGQTENAQHSRRLSFRDLLSQMASGGDAQKRRREWRSWVQQDDVSRDFPFMFPEMVGRRRSVANKDGSLSTMDYCLFRGDSTPDSNHLRLCTVCSSTRSFGTDMWPEYVNEATCSPEDNGCLFTENTANGSCQQVTMSLLMLRKESDHCILVLRDGQQLVAYEWVYVYQDIGVGCQCNVMDESYFVIFV